MKQGPMTLESAVSEADIKVLVSRFYALTLEDKVLGPIFREHIPDLKAHHRVVENFWSHVLLGTERYEGGSPFAHHDRLTVDEEHFDRWMAAFDQAAQETLMPAAAEMAMKRAAHMAKAFKMGMIQPPTAEEIARANDLDG